MADVFISYSKARPELTEALARRLETHGFSVWWDTGLLAHQVFRKEIDVQLDECKAVVIVWTPESIRSDWVVAEADHAWSKRKLINSHSPDLDPKQIPKPFNQVHSVAIGDLPAIRAAVASLVERDGGTGPVPSGLVARDPDRAVKHRRRALIAAGIAALAVVGGTVAMQNATDGLGIRGWLSRAFTGPGAPPTAMDPRAGVPILTQIERERIPLTDIDSNFALYASAPYTHSLLVSGTVSFKTASFNQAAYLGSLRDIDVRVVAPAKGQANRVSFPGGDLFKVNLKGNDSDLSFLVQFRLPQQPAEDDTFVVQAGPLKWPVRFGRLAWSEYKRDPKRTYHREQWQGAFAEVALKADDPDWTAIHYARLLPGRRTDAKKSESLLEVVIENRSPASVALNTIRLSASLGQALRCYCPNCSPTPMQKVVLNWPGIVEMRPGASTSAAWTEMANGSLDVTAEFRHRSCTNPTQFSADIPISHDVPARSMSRVNIALQELPADLPPLAKWTSLAVAITPKEATYPSHVRVPTTPQER